jgi:alkanesulfonate monooxygenase
MKRTPALAARFADECNVSFAPAEHCSKLFAALDTACLRIGRDPSTIRRSAALVVCAGRDDKEIRARAAAIGRDVDELRENGAAGTAPEVAQRLSSWAATGATTLYLQILDLGDLNHLHFIAEEVAPLLGESEKPA